MGFVLLEIVRGGGAWLKDGPRCRRDHPMSCANWPKQLRCDICRANNRKGDKAIVWSCRLCDYDVCPACSGMPAVVVLPSPLPKRVDNLLAEAGNNGMDVQTISFEGWSAL